MCAMCSLNFALWNLMESLQIDWVAEKRQFIVSAKIDSRLAPVQKDGVIKELT